MNVRDCREKLDGDSGDRFNENRALGRRLLYSLNVDICGLRAAAEKPGVARGRMAETKLTRNMFVDRYEVVKGQRVRGSSWESTCRNESKSKLQLRWACEERL